MPAHAPPEIRFWRYVVKRDGDACWEWIGAINANGYGRFRVSMNPDRKEWAHRYAYELAHGPLNPGECALHRCDNRICVRGDHLFKGTRADNAADRDAKGRTSRGERHSQAVRDAWQRRTQRRVPA
jgi:hypothetical protein